MAKAPKASEAKNAVESLSTALTFCKPAMREIGEAYQTHVVMWDGMLFAFDGVLAAGHPTTENIRACPQGTVLRAALVRCREAVALGVTEASLTLKSGRFRVEIPCIDFGMIAPFGPDPNRLPLDETIKEGFAILAPLVSEGAELVIEAALKFGPSSMVATNRTTVAEFWHGFPLPAVALLPKVAVKAVLASPYKLSGFGMSANSATFWFENGAWLKTQLYVEEYPDIGRILNKESTNIAPLNSDYLAGVKAVVPFGNEATHIIYGKDGLQTGVQGSLSASYELPGIDTPVKTKASEWELIGKHIEAVDWLSQPNAVMFFGKNLRGAIVKVAQ